MTAAARLLAFWNGQQTDHAGRAFVDMLGWPDADWEDTHDFIQWLFPCEGRSLVNPHAPQLGPEDVAYLAEQPLTALALSHAWRRFLLFLGLQWDGDKVRATPALNERADDWLTVPTHNDLRITRVLEALYRLGLAREALAFFGCLEYLVRQYRGYNPEGPLSYWREAVGMTTPRPGRVSDAALDEVRAKMRASLAAFPPGAWARLNEAEEPAFSGNLEQPSEDPGSRFDRRHRP